MNKDDSERRAALARAEMDGYLERLRLFNALEAAGARLTIVHDEVVIDVPRATDVKAVQDVIRRWEKK